MSSRLRFASVALIMLGCSRHASPHEEPVADAGAAVCADSTPDAATTSVSNAEDLVDAGIAESVDAAAPDSAELAADDVIELERTSCYGTCPSYRVRIFGDGRVVFKGKYFVPVASAKRRIPRDDAQKIFRSLAGAGFWEWKDRYEVSVTDLPSAIVVVKTGKRTKTVTEYPPCSGPKAAPQALCTLEKSIDSAAQTEEWSQCKDASGQQTQCHSNPSDNTKAAQDAGAAPCSPPYTFDGNGVKHYKMECLER